MAGVDLLVTSLNPLQVEVDEQSFVVPVPVCDRASLGNLPTIRIGKEDPFSGEGLL